MLQRLKHPLSDAPLLPAAPRSVAHAQVFVQSAHMEWHTERNDKVPSNIFELGFKAFATQPGFIAAYVAFLLTRGDVSNARQLFERALAEPDPPLAIWDAYLQVRCNPPFLGWPVCVQSV